MLSAMVLQSAWRTLPADNARAEIFATVAVQDQRLVRDVLAGKRRTITAELEFAGVLLPPGSHWNIGNNIHRPMNVLDRAHDVGLTQVLLLAARGTQGVGTCPVIG